jgi:secretion/DNA translocation related TadE-like protein
VSRFREIRGTQRDRGAASLLLLAIGLVLVAGGIAGAAVGAARVGRHQARVAADLGALAGAVRVIEGEAVACARAAQFVTANGARLTSCLADGLDLIVRAEVTVTPLPGLARTAGATSRAGPITAAAP